MSYIKKPAETKLIAEGGKLMGEILENLTKLLKPGISAWEIDMEAERMIRAAGGIPAFKGYRGRRSDPPFPSTVCFSRNEELVHGIATKDKIVKNGDIVTIDIGMQYPKQAGFFTDTAVTVILGKQPPEVLKLLEVTQEALEVGIRAAQPGATVASIGKAIEQYVKSQGKYGIVRDLVGHGVGHAVHEEPRVPNFYDKALENWVLEPGVVIAIEPMITLGSAEVETADDGWTITPVDRSLNAHFEHTLIITKDGNEVATRRPSEL
jgi:methionyl aminopeptidase